jgi:hypothetical protein
MTTRNTALLAALCAALLSASAFAESEPKDEDAPAPHEFPLGTRTHDYLERQRTGQESSDPHGLTPPAERRARKRYLQSFEHPIPDLFDAKKENKDK